jgi:hypothetical protein
VGVKSRGFVFIGRPLVGVTTRCSVTGVLLRLPLVGVKTRRSFFLAALLSLGWTVTVAIFAQRREDDVAVAHAARQQVANFVEDICELVRRQELAEDHVLCTMRSRSSTGGRNLRATFSTSRHDAPFTRGNMKSLLFSSRIEANWQILVTLTSFFSSMSKTSVLSRMQRAALI